jgi:EmrB/QacA subfamily drug resistance transporter
MCTCVGLVLAMVTTVNTALPVLAEALGAGQAQQTWIVDAYTLVLAALVLPAGALGDRYGRRGVLIIGLVVFALSCAVPLVVDSAGWLIVSRAVTGLGAALIMPATLSIITASFPPGRRSRAIGVWAAIAGLGGLLGLALAGLELQRYSWHAVFVAPAVLAVVLAVCAATVPTSRDRQARPLDPLGTALSALSLGVLVFGILESAEHGWDSLEVIGSLVAGVLLAALFVRVELRRRYPLLDVRLFADRMFAAGSLSVTLQFTAAFGALYGLAQYLQLVQGYSPLKSGLALWPIAVTTLPLALVSAWLSERFGMRVVSCVGLLIIVTGMVLIGRFDPGTSYSTLAVAVAVLGGGLGLTAPPATAAIIDSVPEDKYGVASAVNDATREVGAALGIALAGSVLTAGYTHRMTGATASLPPLARAAADNSIAAALPIAQRLGAAGRGLATAAQSAFSHGMWLSCLVLAAIVFAGMLTLLCLRLPRARRDSAPR